MYPPDSVVHLLKPGPGLDQLPSVSTVMSPKIISAKQTCLQWLFSLFFTIKAPPLPSPECLLAHWFWHASDKGSCMTLDSQSFLRLYWWVNWRANGVVLIITFFCIIYRYFWLSMLVPSFFTCSCTHVLLLSMVQQQQANLMLLLCSKFTWFKLVFVDLWLVLQTPLGIVGCYAAAWLAQLNAWVPVRQVEGGRLKPCPDHQSEYFWKTGKTMMTVIYKI